MSDKVSVIVPFYNSEQYLVRCLDSLKDQTYTDIEVILVDDGSKDNSVSVCRKYTESDDRFHMVCQENQGVSSARNKGIRNSTGKYITFVDSDDHVSPDLIACLYKSISDNQSDLSAAPLGRSERDDFTISLNAGNINAIIYLFETYCLFGPVSKLYRADLIKENDILFPQGISYGEDLLFNLAYLNKTGSISYVNRNLYTYDRDNTGSLSRLYRKDMFEHSMFLNRSLLEWFDKNGLLCAGTEKMVLKRVFDSAYNEISFMFSKNCRFNTREIIQRYDAVLSEPLVIDSLKKVDTSAYSGWIVHMLKHKNAFLLIIISLIKRGF